MSLERIRLADGEPMALMHNYLPAGLVQLNIEMLEQHGLYELLRASGCRAVFRDSADGREERLGRRGPDPG